MEQRDMQRLVVVCCLGALMLLLMMSCEKAVLASLTSASGYVFEILYGGSFDAPTVSLQCRVRRGSSIMYSAHRIGGTSHELAFDLEFVLIDYGTLVAIVEQSAPHHVLAIFDVQNHQAWPYDEGYAKTRQEADRKSKELQMRLQAREPDVPLKFGPDQTNIW